MNLTKEVRDGIVNHRTSGNPSTLEGKVVRLSDKIAYINHDIDDEYVQRYSVRMIYLKFIHQFLATAPKPDLIQ